MEATLNITPEWWSAQEWERAGRAILYLTKTRVVREIRATRNSLVVVLSDLEEDWKLRTLKALEVDLRTELAGKLLIPKPKKPCALCGGSGEDYLLDK